MKYVDAVSAIEKVDEMEEHLKKALLAGVEASQLLGEPVIQHAKRTRDCKTGDTYIAEFRQIGQSEGPTADNEKHANRVALKQISRLVSPELSSPESRGRGLTRALCAAAVKIGGVIVVANEVQLGYVRVIDPGISCVMMDNIEQIRGYNRPLLWDSGAIDYIMEKAAKI